jgi:hypothetical protein
MGRRRDGEETMEGPVFSLYLYVSLVAFTGNRLEPFFSVVLSSRVKLSRLLAIDGAYNKGGGGVQLSIHKKLSSFFSL